MSLGSTYNNNQGSKNGPDVTVYSNYRMNNAESMVDQTCITFRYWKQSLVIGIYPRKATGNDEIAFDMDNGLSIYLNHSKARILKCELENFMRDPVTYNGSGVNAGQAVITISNGLEYGKNTPVLTIRKIDDAGNVLTSFAYEFKTDYYNSIRGYDGYNFTNVREDYKYLEIEQMITLLEEYVRAATNAIAFTVREQTKFDVSRINNKIDLIGEKLGVDMNATRGGNNRSKFNSDSYFNRPNNGGNSGGSSSFTSPSNVAYGIATIDDLD